ncbi:MAG: ATP-binding domain-containing protein, partial [Spirochaetia bacterium]|nr:ATP-binding domain-containing protein [Spirochaetia bacterium]
DTEGGKVGLMTIHAAKGLEFKVVFLAGCEDAIIPHARALEENPANIEEERRLFYVAVTRAMDKLYITSCRMRHHLRDCVTCIPSRFLEEIPAELIQNGEEEKEETPEEATKRMLEQFEKLRARWK